jgi:hypothetical protein
MNLILFMIGLCILSFILGCIVTFNCIVNYLNRSLNPLLKEKVIERLNLVNARRRWKWLG